MKYFILLILICSTFTSSISKAQIVQLKLEVQPVYPSEQDSISILYETLIGKKSYFLDESYAVIGRNINIELCYLYNLADISFHHNDTIGIGLLPQGKYQINLQAFISDSACLNRFDTSSIVDSFIVSSAVSIQEKQWADQLKIFPNPAKNVLNIHLPDKNLTIEKLKVKDVQGREISIQTSDLESNFKRINLNELPSGIYFLEIKSNKGNVVRQFEVRQY